MTQQTFDVDGLHCSGCVNTVKETILALSGVTAVDVTLGTNAPSVVRIETDGGLDPDLVQRSLAERGDFCIRR
ncbi:heavy-metal-associated domain-containing protein [Mycolicibacterium sp.]|uniref:heavy-metal-associated domain-containing protein n=1 Tax=Mycolicibacterium sp. TaxID=2320850 RepID=UPI003D0D95B5